MQELIARGDSLKMTLGTVRIELQWTDGDTFNVTVHRGVTRIDELSQAFHTEADARTKARGYALALKAGASIERIIEVEAIANTAKVTLATLVPAQRRREIRPTMAGAQLADLTPAQLRTIAKAAANGGTIHAGGDITRPMLKALDRKGYGVIGYEPRSDRRKIVDSLTLNDRGWRESDALVAA